jgi:hypothetical protein
MTMKTRDYAAQAGIASARRLREGFIQATTVVDKSELSSFANSLLATGSLK